jgi:hypothetical protein
MKRGVGGSWARDLLARGGWTAQAVDMHPDDLPPTGELVVPDDARDLDREVLAYHRELRAARRSARMQRLLPGSRHYTPRAAAIVAVTIALVLSVLAGLVAVLGPGLGRPDPPDTARPLASPTVAPGRVGGLLPALTLVSPPEQAEATTEAIRSFRPGAIVLVPPQCRCEAGMADVLRTADDTGLNTLVVAAGHSDPELAALADPDPRTGAAAEPLLDTTGVLAALYGASDKPVLLVVDATGIVQRTVTGLTGSTDGSLAVRAALEILDLNR